MTIIIHGSSLVSDCSSGLEPEGPVESSRLEDDLWEAGCGRDVGAEDDTRAVDGQSMERLGPPFIRRKAESWNCSDIVGKLLDFFLDG